jgi:hypothetical protein
LDLDDPLTRTCVHEASHALIDYYFCKAKVERIEVFEQPVEGMLGRTLARIPNDTPPFVRAVAALAGMAGEEALGGGGSRAGGAAISGALARSLNRLASTTPTRGSRPSICANASNG